MNRHCIVQALRISRTAFMLAVLGAACDSATDPGAHAWQAELAPQTSGGVSGTVAAVTQGGRTEASILIEDAEPETTYGWRINAGSCADEGGITGGQAVYPDVTTGATGTGTEETSFAELLDANGSYAARVFQPGNATVLACGDLERVR